MQEIIDLVSGALSSLLIIPLIGTGIYLTIRLKLVQMFHFGHSWKVIAGVYDNPDDEGDINHLQALSAALSATIGIGNIAGVATAIHFGGPGALFWMWVTAALGMATKFGEATLAMVYRKIHKDGSASGGPMYYIEMGLGKGWKWLAVTFAFCTIISSFGSGNTVQSFTVADSFRGDLGIPTWITGLTTATLVGLVVLGGIKRIGSVASKLVPFMAFVYIASAIIVVSSHIAEVPAAFALIFESAFSARAGIGGFAGSTFYMALLWGVKRGLFSNESGQGSAPIAHAAAKTDEPVREGTVAMVGPFIDTLLICTLTGLTIITTGAWHERYPTTMETSDVVVVEKGTSLGFGGTVEEKDLYTGNAYWKDTSDLISENDKQLCFIYNQGFVTDPRFLLVHEDNSDQEVDTLLLKIESGGILSIKSPYPRSHDFHDELLEHFVINGKALRNGSLLTAQAFAMGLGNKWGTYMVAIGVFLFGLSTAISWSYYGDRAVVYLFGHKGVRLYRIIFVVVHFIGANLALETIWGFGDIALAMMAFPNLIALIFLAPKLQKLKEDYFSREHVPFK